MYRDIKGFIFDLDGVIVDTRPYHLEAWQRLSLELGVEVDADRNEILRGMSRMQGVEQILCWGGHYATEAEKMYWGDIKNNWYLNLIAKMNPDEVLPGVVHFLQQAAEGGYPLALVSSSQNARKVLKSVRIDVFFDAVVDGTIAKKRKPDPDCFLLAAEAIGIPPAQCLVFEDAPVGVAAALNGGLQVVAVGPHRHLCNAPNLIVGFEDLTPAEIIQMAASGAQPVTASETV